MHYPPLMTSFAFVLVGLLASPTASADCDITTTKCHQNGGKCNIKFRNQTGVSGGSNDTGLDRQASAQIIRVKAVKDNDKAAGNVINIEAGTSKTMNIDKKYNKDFAKIRISSPTLSVSGITMSCAHVKTVLDGDGTCKVIAGTAGGGGQLGYQCEGSKVANPD
jgi:predicted methyltransferase